MSCEEDSAPQTENIIYGKNRFTLNIDGVEREYYVHVPKNYNGKIDFSVVFMLHGTSGDGEKFYAISGWKELAETDSIITVFPSSGRHCIIDADKQIKTTTKWNSQPSEWAYCPNEKPNDDLKFLRTIIDDVDSRYQIDLKRIYLVGFSNGGQMAAKAAIFLSDKFAAIVEDAGSFYVDSVYRPVRKLPTAFFLGNLDYGPGVEGPDVPLSRLPEILENPPPLFKSAVNTHINSFDLNKNFSFSGDTSTVVVATYPSLDGSEVKFLFTYVKGLGHVYPNSVNHFLNGPRVHYDWLKQFKLP